MTTLKEFFPQVEKASITLNYTALTDIQAYTVEGMSDFYICCL